MIETEFQEAALREELETSHESTVAQKSYVYFHFQHFQLLALNFPFINWVFNLDFSHY